MKNYALIINNDKVKTTSHFDVLNPATEKVIAHCPSAGNENIDAAVESANTVFHTWKSLSYDARRPYFEKAACLLEAHRDELATLLSQEQGKTLAQAEGETDAAINKLRYVAKFQVPQQIIQDDDEHYVEVLYKPLGVICAITPWNFPLSIGVGKFAMAAFAGNTVVLKPSPQTPLTSLRVGELLSDIFPPGVLNLVTCLDRGAAHLTAHPAIAKYTFTGSVPTGKIIGKIAAEQLKPVTLELGGNDAAIVLPDINIAEMAPKLFWAAFGNCGQICIATKRLFVHESIKDDLIAELLKVAATVKLGNGLDEGVNMGPLNNANQRDLVSELVEDAKKEGATILCGGNALGGNGYFYEPTLITDVTDDTRIVCEEQFGPALPILTYTDIDEAIQRANSLPFGLGGSVWSSDVAKATELAKRLDTGIAWVNERGGVNPNAPFGGAKESGLGRENGLWGFEQLVELQTLVVAK